MAVVPVINAKDLLSNLTGKIDFFSGDDLSAALAAMSAKKIPLVIQDPLVLSSGLNVSGWCDIRTEGKGSIVFTGTEGVKVTNTYQQITTFSATSLVRYPTSTGAYVSTITVASNSNIAAKDVLYIKDSTAFYANDSTGNPVYVAEYFRVLKVSGTTIYLEGRIRDAMTSGTVYKVDQNKCSIKGSFAGDQITKRNVIQLDYCVDPTVDVVIDGNCHVGLFLRSCYLGNYTVKTKNLKDDPNSNPQNLGYGVVAYGACKGGRVFVHAESVRHAYTDGMWNGQDLNAGVALDMTISGVAVSCTAAAWDTHPYSDGARFENIRVINIHNDDFQTALGGTASVQIRGTNVTIDGLDTDENIGITYDVYAYRDSETVVQNVRHRNRISGALAGSYVNELVTFRFFSKQGAGAHKFRAFNVDGFYIKYETTIDDEYIGCRLDWGKTTGGWPSSPSSGGYHQFHNCVITNPVNMSLGANDEWRIYDSTIKPSTAKSFNCATGTKLTAIRATIDCLLTGGNVPNAAFAYATAGVTSVTLTYAHLSVLDGRAEGTLVAFSDQTGGGLTLTKKNIAIT
jgi:hypothetical protein